MTVPVTHRNNTSWIHSDQQTVPHCWFVMLQDDEVSWLSNLVNYLLDGWYLNKEKDEYIFLKRVYLINMTCCSEL